MAASKKKKAPSRRTAPKRTVEVPLAELDDLLDEVCRLGVQASRAGLTQVGILRRLLELLEQAKGA